jgi:hypothetical protein
MIAAPMINMNMIFFVMMNAQRELIFLLIIFKIEQAMEELLIPLIEYEIFNPKTKEKLDLNYCKNENIYIEIYIPATINKNIIYKYDHNSSYYNDICNTSTTEYGTDITLYDRKNEFNNNNLFICPANCEYINYNIDNKRVLCQCEIQNGIFLDSTKTINHFKNLKYTSNIKVLKCFRLFSKEGLLKNIAFYIISLIILLYIILGIYFYFKEYKIYIKEIFEIANFTKRNNKLIQKKIIILIKIIIHQLQRKKKIFLISINKFQKKKKLWKQNKFIIMIMK